MALDDWRGVELNRAGEAVAAIELERRRLWRPDGGGSRSDRLGHWEALVGGRAALA